MYLIMWTALRAASVVSSDSASVAAQGHAGRGVKALAGSDADTRHVRPARCNGMARQFVGGIALAAPSGLALQQVETGDEGRRHLHRVPQTSPSPCAKCASPTEKSAPATWTGDRARAGGELLHVEVAAVLARRDGAEALLAMGVAAGTAPQRRAAARMPPLRESPASRPRCAASSSCDGATPITPMNGAPGIRTPGSSGEVPSRSRSPSAPGTAW